MPEMTHWRESSLHGNELLLSGADEMEDGRFGDVILKFGRSRTHWVNEASSGWFRVQK